MTEILLVRHGQSEWNAQGRWQGQADPPLSPLGRQQAMAAGVHLAGWPSFDGPTSDGPTSDGPTSDGPTSDGPMSDGPTFDGIATSTLDRAATTGDLIAGRLGFDQPYRCNDLAERSAGEWSGLTRYEIEERYPGFLRERKYPAGYEYDDELSVRIRRGLLQVLANVPGERIVVVAHGGLLYCIEAAFNLPFRHMSNLGARWLSVDSDGSIELGDRVDLLVDFDGKHTTPRAI